MLELEAGKVKQWCTREQFNFFVDLSVAQEYKVNSDVLDLLGFTEEEDFYGSRSNERCHCSVR